MNGEGRALRRAAGPVGFGLVAATFAALVAHYVIDIVGDYALPHDTYDAIGHEAPGLLWAALVLGLVLVAYRFIGAAVGGVAARKRISAFLSVPRFPIVFAALVTLATVGLVVGMEAVDATLAGDRLDGIADGLGGSIALGLAITLPIGASLGFAAWSALRWFARYHGALLRTIQAAFVIALPSVPAGVRFFRSRIFPRRSCTILRRAAKRGPPAPQFG